MVRTTSVAQLKSHLSEFLRLVKTGTDVVITERGTPVAKVVRLDTGERSSRRSRLTRAGQLIPGRGPKPASLGRAPHGPAAGVVAALLAERRESEER